MRLHRHLTFLTMTTALVAATAAGAWAQDTTSKETGVNLSGEAQPFDITSHLRAMHGMTVVNHKGQPLGTLFDVVVDFSNKEVIYALMSGQPGQRQGQQSMEGEQQTAEGEQQDVGEASGNQETAEAEGEGEQGRMAMGALYPIPIEAIEILDRSVLDAQVSKAQQTAKGEQATEGEQQTAEGAQLTTEGEQQTAEGEQKEVGEASGHQETAEAEGEGVTAEGEQETAEGAEEMPAAEQETAEGAEEMSGAEQETAEGAEEMSGAEQETAEGELQTTEGEQQTAESQEQSQALAEMTVGDIVGMTVVSRDGESIADIAAVVQGSDQAVAVLGVGGFLGIGEKSVAVRLDQLALNQEGDALVLAATREDLENATEVEYESEQIVPDETRVARLMESGQQGQSEQQAQSGQQEETEQQDQAEQQEETEQQAQSDQQEETEQQAQSGQQEEPEQQDQAEQQGEAEQQDQMAAAETGAETKAGSPIAGEITTLKGKVLMVSISKEALQQAPSFEQGDFPEVADAEWQEAVLAFYEKILDTEGTDPALGTGDESTEGETTQ